MTDKLTTAIFLFSPFRDRNLCLEVLMREPYAALILEFRAVGSLCLLISIFLRKRSIHALFVTIFFWSFGVVVFLYGLMWPVESLSNFIISFVCILLGWLYYKEHPAWQGYENQEQTGWLRRLPASWQERIRDFRQMIEPDPNRSKHW